ncbi:glutathione S-transferase [Phaeobacter italicus]|jgi:glutathione S-transferase|uniref:glutathione S-transferase n=1 Tax=Phaeobacter italicus TaxID=481446 RepID=UPI002FDB0770
MKLFIARPSPFSRKVLVVAQEGGAFDDLELAYVTGNALDPQTLPVAHNPLGKIPTLVLNNGQSLYDSRVICRYLCEKYAPQLLDVRDTWADAVLEATADGLMEAAVLIVYETRLRPAEVQFQPWIDGQWQKIERSLRMFEAALVQNSEYLNVSFSLGHIALACALGYIDFRMPEKSWRESYPHLSAWEKKIADRPSFAMTRPEAE